MAHVGHIRLAFRYSGLPLKTVVDLLTAADDRAYEDVTGLLLNTGLMFNNFGVCRT